MNLMKIKNKNKVIMPLKVKNKQLLKKYNKIWKKVEKLMRIDFDSKATYDKYIKTKIKTYKDSITTNFYNKKGSKKYLKMQMFVNNNFRSCSLCI